MKKHTKVIGTDVKDYIDEVKKSEKTQDFNQKLSTISFELSKLKLFDSFYDKHSSKN